MSRRRVQIDGEDEDESKRAVDYTGDYLSVPTTPYLFNILQKQGDKKVFFADRVLKFTSSGKMKRRILLMTDFAIYIVDPDTGTLKRRVSLAAVEKICLSELSDNFLAIVIPTEYDILLASTRKSEIVAMLLEGTKSTSDYELEVFSSNSFEYNAAAHMVKEIIFEEAADALSSALWTRHSLVPLFSGQEADGLVIRVFKISTALESSENFLLLACLVEFAFKDKVDVKQRWMCYGPCSAGTLIVQNTNTGLVLISAIYNGVLGLGYFCLGVLTLEEKWRRKQTIVPLNWRLLVLFHGLTWLLLSLALSLWGKRFSRVPMCILSVFAFLYWGVSFALSSFAAIAHKELAMIITSDALSFLGASLLLLCTYKRLVHEENENDLYSPLNGDCSVPGLKTDPVGIVTPLSRAGFFSKMSFWWLNPLMKKGRKKTLQDEDIPKLRKEDQAETCYLLFTEQLNKQKAKDPWTRPSVLRTIILCHQRNILISGCFALLKIISISAGPLLLNAFINASEVGLATVASLAAILLTVLSNTPLAKLQHKFQSKLMLAQDERLKFSSEALVNMKVLKLYAWENHFKNAIIKLRTVEFKWLSIVQLLRAYNSFLFWSSPVLVSAATFGACYFIGVPLNASNVFTFVATFRLVQDPVRCIPDLIGVVIQANVAFTRILNFLVAPELDTSKVRHNWDGRNANCNIVIKSADLSWEENPVKLTLQNINLEVRVGEKVAICGEVGSGKSTLLAAILGEVPKINDGTLMSHGKILHAAPYHLLMASSRDFQDLVDAHNITAGSERLAEINPSQESEIVYGDIRRTHTEKKFKAPGDDHLIKQEEREVGDAGLKPYMQYINQNKGLPLFSLAIISHLAFVTCQILQNFWMAANVENPDVSTLRLILVYLVIGLISTLFLFSRSLASVFSGLHSSKSMFSQLLESLFRAPMSFYDSTPLGRILSRVSADLSIVDIDLPFSLIFTVTATTNACSNVGVIAVVTWEVLFVAIPMIYVVILLQVLGKCQLRETIQEKEAGLDCLGELVEFDEPMHLMKKEGSLFRRLVKEYWSQYHSAESH
uniref:ABC transmembrane type-1 domain-containing protein n=1 Tax=Daucus carota subsp. sativus TaxID=79200 RepID=A0A162AAV0_DAUCS